MTRTTSELVASSPSFRTTPAGERNVHEPCNVQQASLNDKSSVALGSDPRISKLRFCHQTTTGVVWKFGNGVPAQILLSSFDPFHN
ncbi:hypothetical protein AVEN_86315-1 [Araneus ventricosus]|uniref:Uncharacterized protein n=1 Tax=Araneus ventricosus TaxID=182803 RepID=A0A4Y2PHM8_ARAVE|nr:hypothetical protein AVEN_86315-1 [Araneus ventricosus]